MRSADFFATHRVFAHEEYLSARGDGRDRSPRTADSLLTRHAAADKVLHVRRGLYAAVPAGATSDTFQVDPFLLATRLAPDAAAAFHAALQFRGKAYSVWHRFAVLTRSHLRSLTFHGSEFVGVRPPRALDEVYVLVRLLDAMRTHPFLGPRMALKKGTALNLFFLDLRRLSVDIDVNYIGSSDRATMLAERPRIEQALKQVTGRMGLTIKRARARTPRSSPLPPS